MARRDSLFGETILWRGRPARAEVPLVYRITAITAAVFSTSTLLFSVVNAMALHRSVGGMLAFSAWCALLAVAAWRLPLVWAEKVEYLVTEKHVIVKRGPLRRTIDRSQISYAIIRWSRTTPNVGALVLERAVPTGALKRTLRLELSAVEAPDRVLALIRGVRLASSAPAAPSGSPREGAPPLPQRLEEGERVLWSAIPTASPWTKKRVLGVLIGAGLLVVVGKSLVRFVPAMTTLARAHVLSTFLFTLLVAATVLVLLGLVALAVSAFYSSWIRPKLLARQTRYFVTDRRVLIRRGNEELHLDRARIAYVITAPAASRATDVYLVLDGPQARAMSVSGAFGAAADDDALKPVFTAVADSETASEILKLPAAGAEQAPLRDAA
ncbi:MAG: hypothetical protein JNL38_16895 [Myxococcales bacterium]|jgi:hypothetical protein|nr:hypothetical protein [Myxococcales bacterium]